jgi:hypothetical protein
MECIKKWAEDTVGHVEESNSKEWYLGIAQHCVVIPSTSSQITSDFDCFTHYFKNIKPHNKSCVGVIGTVQSSKFITGFPNTPTRLQPDLVLSLHGLTPGDVLNINGHSQYDMLGTGPDFTFLQPFNVCASLYSDVSIMKKDTLDLSPGVSFRALWIMKSTVRDKAMRHSSKLVKVTYDAQEVYPFCIYSGTHIPWEARHVLF